MAAAEVKNTIQLICNFWPDLNIDKVNLPHHKPEFIVRYFTAFITELNDKICYLINEESITDEFDDIRNFDPQVPLFCRLVKFFSKVQLTALNLCDLYTENPKKIFPFLKFSIHFVVYLNNALDEMSAVTNESLNKLLDCENLKDLKEQILQELAEITQNLTRAIDVSKDCERKIEKTKNAEKVMMEKKLAEEVKQKEERMELEKLQNEIDNLQFELKLVEEKENKFKECIIDESEYETLKNTEKYLEIEREQQLSSDFAIYKQDVENLYRLEELAKQLSGIQCDIQIVESLHEIGEQVKANQTLYNSITNDLNVRKNEVSTAKENLERLKRKRDEYLQSYTDLKNEFMKRRDQEDQNYQKGMERCGRDHEEYQRIQTTINERKDEIKKIKFEEEMLNQVASQYYRRRLSVDEEVTEYFYNFLKYVKNMILP